jgi:hypothetical protein
LDALTDLDIETDTTVIQVKSGRIRGLSTQLIQSKTVTSKPVVAYAPRMDDHDLADYERRGFVVFRDLPHLLGYLEQAK